MRRFLVQVSEEFNHPYTPSLMSAYAALISMMFIVWDLLREVSAFAQEVRPICSLQRAQNKKGPRQELGGARASLWRNATSLNDYGL